MKEIEQGLSFPSTARLMSMTEVEREAIIYERAQAVTGSSFSLAGREAGAEVIKSQACVTKRDRPRQRGSFGSRR